MPPVARSTVLIVGGGIVGLCVAYAANRGGYEATVIDDGSRSASSVAAGMVAPALEALTDPDPVLSYMRLKTAQAAWADFKELALPSFDSPSLFVTEDRATTQARLAEMGATFRDTPQGIAIDGEELVDAEAVLADLRAQVTVITGQVQSLTATSVNLSDGRTFTAGKVVMAAGFGAHRFADDVPSLAALTPIKGHIIDLPPQGEAGVVRGASGYRAHAGTRLRVGATMQPGQSDTEVESDKEAGLRGVGEALGLDMRDGTTMVGIRASTPDGWPLIGRDAVSGVWVATGMRRNGFIFAPYAAKALVAAWQGAPLADAVVYDPNRSLNAR